MERANVEARIGKENANNYKNNQRGQYFAILRFTYP